MQVRFQLPLAGRKTPALVSCSARIIHTERLAQDSYHAGIQFIRLGETAAKALQTYIGEQQRSTETP